MERVGASWRALDDRFERRKETPWGAVVTDPRFPMVHDVNYARIDPGARPVTLRAVEAELRPALADAGSPYVHVVVLEPDRQHRLLTEASMRGAPLRSEIVMTRPTDLDAPTGTPVTEIRSFGSTFRAVLARSLREFDVTDPAIAGELVRLELDVMVPAGKRWFAVRRSGRAVALGSLTTAGGAGLIDHVVTLPAARRRGYAEAIVRRMVAEAGATGADVVWLLADPDGAARHLYERLGFEASATILSTLEDRR